MADRTCVDCGADVLRPYIQRCEACCARPMIDAGMEPLEPYPGAQKPWGCRCLRCGTVGSPRRDNIVHGWGGCQACGRASQSVTRRLSASEAEAVMHAAGLKLLEPYQGVMTPWRSRCSICGQEVSPLLSNIRKGQAPCKWCAKHAVDPLAAVEVMISAGLQPLEPYPGRHEPWRCLCVACGNEVSPQYGAILDGGGCRHCAISGFKPDKDAFVYLVTHAGYGAAKIGVSSTSGVRLLQHTRRGWEVVATVRVLGRAALRIEAEILRWWREELRLPAYLGQVEMPQNGWTETVDLNGINILAVIARMRHPL